MPGGQVGGDDLQVDAVRGRAGLLLAGLVVGALGGVDDASAGVRRAAEVNRQFEAALARLQLVVGAAWTPELARAFGEEIRAESAAGYSLGAEIARVEETALRWSNNHRRPFVEREGELHGLRVRVTYVEPGQRMMELSAGPVPGRADAGLQLVQVGRESASSRAWHRAARWAENLANEARMVGLPVEAVARAHAEVWASLDLGGVGVVAEDIDDPHSEEGRERARWYAAVYQARLESEVEQLARAMGQHPADLFEAIERLQPPVASKNLRRLEVRDDLVKPDSLTPDARAKLEAWYAEVLARRQSVSEVTAEEAIALLGNPEGRLRPLDDGRITVDLSPRPAETGKIVLARELRDAGVAIPADISDDRQLALDRRPRRQHLPPQRTLVERAPETAEEQQRRELREARKLGRVTSVKFQRWPMPEDDMGPTLEEAQALWERDAERDRKRGVHLRKQARRRRRGW